MKRSYISNHTRNQNWKFTMSVTSFIKKTCNFKELISTSVKINKQSKLTKPTFPDSFKQYKI